LAIWQLVALRRGIRRDREAAAKSNTVRPNTDGRADGPE